MRRHIIVALLLVVFTCSSNAFWNDETLQHFEDIIGHASYFRSVCLEKVRKVTVATYWESNRKNSSSEINMLLRCNKEDKEEIKSAAFYVYEPKKGEILTVDYFHLIDGNPYRYISKGNFKDFIGRDYIWTNIPGRFLILGKNAKNIKEPRVKEFLGEKWIAYCGECERDLQIISEDERNITFEILVSTNKKSWLEIYRRKDGSVIAAREGVIDDKRNPVNQNPPGSQTKLLERYLQKYHESYIQKIMELPME